MLETKNLYKKMSSLDIFGKELPWSACGNCDLDCDNHEGELWDDWLDRVVMLSGGIK